MLLSKSSRHRLNCCLAGLAAVGSIGHFGSAAKADSLIDNINGSATPPFVYYAGPTDIGWYYTPTFSYTLDGIFSTFEPVPNGTGSRTITVQIQTERPVNGGTLLAQGTFTGNSATGGNLGANFAPVNLVAGHTYFVDFLNTVGMGVNLGQWDSNGPGGTMEPSNGATKNLGAWYGDVNGDTTFSQANIGPAYYTTSTGNVSFSEPILDFRGTALPEPASLGSIGFAAMVLIARRSRRQE